MSTRMSSSTAVQVIDALDEGLGDIDSISVHFYGGEPLIHMEAVAAMVKRAQEKRAGRFSFAVTTNGTCGSQEVIDLLGDAGFQIVLSVDGPPAIHDECRRTAAGAPTHETVMGFLNALRAQTDCWVRGSAVVRSGWRLSQAIEYLRTLPVDRIKAQAVRAPADSPYTLSVAERRTYLEDLETIGRRVIAELEAGEAPMDDRYSSRVLQLLMGKTRERFCGAGLTTFGISPDGHVLACALLDARNGALGHVDDNPATWVRAGVRWRESLQRSADCETCSSFPLCGGGCPAMVSVCGPDECEIIRKNCEVATEIYDYFRSTPEALLPLADIE